MVRLARALARVAQTPIHPSLFELTT